MSLDPSTGLTALRAAIAAPCDPAGDPILEALNQPAHRLALHPESPGGLLLQGAHYSDIIFPGASLVTICGFDCQDVHRLGEIQIYQPITPAARRYCRQRRADGITALQRIITLPNPTKRAFLLVSLLSHRFGLAALQPLPPDSLAGVVASRADDIVAGIARYEQHLSHLAASGRLTHTHYLAWQRQQYTPVSQGAVPPPAPSPGGNDHTLASRAETTSPR